MAADTPIPQAFYDLLPAYVDRMTSGTVHTMSLQKLEWKKGDAGVMEWLYSFKETHALLTTEDWEWHFYKSPLLKPHRKVGSIGLRGIYGDDPATRILKYLVFDLDDQRLVDLFHDAIEPYLQHHAIEHIFETSGTEAEPRGHVWVMLDGVKHWVAENWVNQMLKDVGSSKADFDEIYNVNEKTQGIMRQPYGPHIKRANKRYPCHWNGRLLDSVLEVMQAFIDIPVLTEARILELTRIENQEEPEAPAAQKFTQKVYHYFPLRLETDLDYLQKLPKGLVMPVRNCKALQVYVRKTLDDGYLGRSDESGKATRHNWGFLLTRACMWNDFALKRTDGQEFINAVLHKTRTKSWANHKWASHIQRVMANPGKFFPSCKALEQFGQCGGCPHYGSIQSPRRFGDGTAEPIRREVLEDVTHRAKTPEEIRSTTLKEIEDLLDIRVATGARSTVLIASPQQAGKSYMATSFAAKQASYGKKILICVPTAQLAYEYRDRFADVYGVPSYILGSQKTLFKGHHQGRNIAKQECPEQDSIDSKVVLGLHNASIRKQVCSLCPLQDSCPWIGQFGRALQEEHRVIIIQHAHLGIRQVMSQLSRKGFDVAIVDESFTEMAIDILKPSYQERKIIGGKRYQWCRALTEWFAGGPMGKEALEPSEDELADMESIYRKVGLPWRLPDYVRAYNNRSTYDTTAGIETVARLPWAPLRILLDATPPVTKTRMVTGIDSIEVLGEGELIDYLRIHPDNEVLQVLDSTVSKTNLKNFELFYECLAKIAYEMRYRYPEEKALITAYKGWDDDVWNFFQKVPGTRALRDRVDVATMSRGTNKWASHGLQYILASVNFTGREYYDAAYKAKAAYNFHQRLKGWDETDNLYPYDVYEGEALISVAIEPELVERLEYEGNRVVRARYEQFKNWRPKMDNINGDLYNLSYDENISAYQQSNRMRFQPGVSKRIRFLGNQNLRGIIIRKTVTMTQWLNDLTC